MEWVGHDPTGIAFLAGWQDCLDPAGMALGGLGGTVCLDPDGLDPTGIAYLVWVADRCYPTGKALVSNGVE